MSICVVDGKHCRCSPSEGCPCPALVAERANRTEPDCRTCAQFYEIPRSKPCLACKDGDQHQSLPPVRLYRSKT